MTDNSILTSDSDISSLNTIITITALGAPQDGDTIQLVVPNNTISVFPATQIEPSSTLDTLHFGSITNDIILLGDDDNAVITRTGADYVELGGGNDWIVFTSVSDSSYDDGVDFIGDFVQGEDRIDLTLLGYSDISQLSFVKSDTGFTEIFDPSNNLAIAFDGDYTFTASDFLFAAPSTNIINGTEASDNLIGTAANDVIASMAGNDNLYGGAGDDTFTTGTGGDYMELGKGNDTILISDVSDSSYADGVDYIGDFVQGEDKIDVSALGFSDVSDFFVFNNGSYTEYYDLASGFALGFNGDYTLTNDDFVLAEPSAEANVVSGTSGDDMSLVGTAGVDEMLGLSGNDNIYAGAGDDIINTGTGGDYMELGKGNDTILVSDVSDSSYADGVDFIGDFVQGEDKIDMSATGFADVSDFTVFNNGSYTEYYDLASGFAMGFNGDYTLTNDDFVF